MKCHYCKIHFIGEQTGSRVLKGQGHLTSRVTQLGYDGAGIRIQLFMTPNPVLQASKMQPWGFLVNPFFARALDHNPLSARKHIGPESWRVLLLFI